MKKILVFLLLLFSLSQLHAQSALTVEQRKFITEYLQITKQEFLKSIEGLTDEQLKFRVSEKKWRIIDCAEHIALAEKTLFSIVEKKLTEPADSVSRKHLGMTEKKIISRLTFRLIKVNAPEVIRPFGRFATIDAIKQAFTARRDSTINFVGTTNLPLHCHFWKHPATGKIDLYQTIILMSAHTKRHILQIEEVKNSSGFPTIAR
jgi:DNA primase catalytic subunit